MRIVAGQSHVVARRAWAGTTVLRACIMTLCIAASASAQSVTARANATSVEVGDTISVVVEVANPRTASMPVPEKSADFEISLDQTVANPATNQMYQNINGRESTTVTYSYTFEAKALRTGRLTIPRFKVNDGEQVMSSQPIVVNGKRPSDTPDLICRVFRRDEETPKVYVGQKIELTLEIMVRKFRQGNYEMDVNSAWSLLDRNRSSMGVFSEDRNPRWGETTRKGEQGRGSDYWVYSLDATVFPPKPGPLDLGSVVIAYRYPIQLSSNVFGQMYLEQERKVLQRPALPELQVLPLPLNGRPPDFNGAVGTYSISAAAKPMDVGVGDPVTLTLFIRGSGPLERLSAPKLEQVEALTKDFEISGDSPAGSLEGGTKVFSQTIRPLRDDVTKIPPVPISFFNPKTEKYEQSLSEPIPIRVRAGQKLALANPAGTPIQAQNVLAPLTESSEGLIANETNVSRLLASQAASIGAATWGMLAGFPLVYAGVWFVRQRTERFRSDDTYRRRTHAYRRAKAALANPTPGGIRAAVVGYVADRCGVPAGGMTRADARRLLESRQIARALVEQVDTLLDLVEQAQYGGGSAGTDVAAEGQRLIDALEKERLS
ncbi:MAG: BatD family protein [Planctomycetes bacterium]|nr:BatD family protein [Planctomycetota bacterium]